MVDLLPAAGYAQKNAHAGSESVILRIAAILSVLMLGACGAKMPPFNFGVADVGPSATKLDAELKSLTVSIARPDEATGDINQSTAAITGLWKESIEDSLAKMAIFSDSSQRKVSITVKVLKLDVSQIFPGATTDTAARYDIIDRANGAVIHTQDISSRGQVDGDYAFAAVVKIRESLNRSIQNNVAQFLQSLSKVDLPKLAAPATAKAN